MEKPFRGLLCSHINEANVVLTGLPYDLGCSCGTGANLAPKVMRELSAFLPPLTMDGKSIVPLKIYDNGDIEPTNDYYNAVETKTKELFYVSFYYLLVEIIQYQYL